MPSTSELSPIAIQSGQPAGSGEATRAGLQPLELFRKHGKLALGVFLCMLALGMFSLKLSFKPKYEATSIVYVSPIFPNALGDDHDHDRQYDAFLEQQITEVARYETLQKVLRLYPDEWPKFGAGETEQSQIQRLQGSLRVEQIGHSYEIAITLESMQPAHLASLVNHITAVYLEDARAEEVYGQNQKLATLSQEKTEIEKQLSDAMEKRSQLLQYVGVAHLDVGGGGANPIDDHLNKLREQYGDAHEKSLEADAELNSLGTGNTSGAGLQEAALEEVNADPTIIALKASLASKKASNLALMTGLKQTNPLYTQMAADNAEIDQRLDQINREAMRKAEVRIQQKASTSRARAASLEGQLSSDIAKTTQQATSAAPRLQQAQVVSSEIERLLASEGVIESRIQNISLENDAQGSAHLFSSALPPTGPVQRKMMVAYGGVILFSLFWAIAAAFIADKVDPRIYTSADIRRLVGFPPIGLLLNRTEFSPDMQREYYLRLAGGLDQAHRRTGARTFVFPSVGRSSSRPLVEQLGAELAANGLRVLVVNIQPPSGPEKTGPQMETQVPNPRLLTVTDGASQLSAEADKEPYRVISLPAAEVADLLRRSRSYYNAILVAADPLFTSAYTEHFARTADGTVLIVDSGETRKDELVRAARLLERLKIAGIAIVLNGVTERRAEEDVARTLADYKKSAA